VPASNIRLYEAGAIILFFGILNQQTDLKQSGINALAELAAQGYQIPAANDPVRVFPVLTQAHFSSHHAGGWSPGNIYLRVQPEGDFGASVYLRHELFHEASFRSCGEHLPEWAEEIGAMRFSGELEVEGVITWPSKEEIQNFHARIQKGAPLNGKYRMLLKHLASQIVWPTQPCVIPSKLEKLLGKSAH
jgi:hypothetical protein